MHPAFSVIFLTTLIGAGQGLFLALFTGQIFSQFKLMPEQQDTSFYVIGSVIAVGLLILGMFAAIFHLGVLKEHGVQLPCGELHGSHVKLLLFPWQ